MALLYMRTEQVQSTAGKLLQLAIEIHEHHNRLHGSLAQLQGNWQGPGQAAFSGELMDMLQHLNRLADSAHNLGDRVHAEIEEWLAVDAQLGVGGSVLGAETDSLAVEGEDDSWFDFLRRNPPGSVTQIQFLSQMAAAGYILTHMKSGTQYAGQLKLYGSTSIKSLAETSPNLTHIRGSNLGRHISKSSNTIGRRQVAFAIIDMSSQWRQNYRDYGDRPSAFWPAMVFDTTFIGGTGIVAGAAGAKVGAIAGGAAGSVIPVFGTAAGAAAGAVIGGAIGSFAASWAADVATEKLYTESEIRTELIEDSAYLIDTSLDSGQAAIENVLDTAVESIESVRLPVTSPAR